MMIDRATGQQPLPPPPNPFPPAYVQIEAAYRKADHSLDQIIQRLVVEHSTI
jgi:hypothetical protein